MRQRYIPTTDKFGTTCAEKQGDRFLMEDSKGNLVPRSEEGSLTTGTVMEMIQEHVNSGARYNEDVIFLRTEADSEAS